MSTFTRLRVAPAPGRTLFGPAATAWWSAAGPLGLLCAGAIGCAFAWWLFSLALLDGTAPFWHREGADISQYLAGFNAFVHEPWHWPLLRVESLNAPEGTLATFVDAIPLYAMLWKLVQHGPDTPFRNPFGLYIGLCFVLQGIGAWWICREANTRRWAVLLAMTLLLVSFPALTFRISHTSLTAQWLLLFGLAIYIRSSRLGQLAVRPWVALLPCAFYLNIYIFAMVSALFAADVARQLIRGPVRPALVAPLLAYGLLFASMFVTMLPMPPGSGEAEWGFGYYSMNILSPLHGGRMLEFDAPQAHDGQGEGYNYLGVFLLALAAYAWRLRRRADPALRSRHLPLLVVLVLLTLYALSNIVYLGPIKLVTVNTQLLDPISSTFRASGRFFWPVGYALVVFTVIGIARHLPPRRAALLLLAVTALQLWDLGPHFKRCRAGVQEKTETLIDVARWEAFLGKDVRAIHYYPPFRCNKSPSQPLLLPTMLYAVKHGLPMSTGYIARARKSCDNYAAEIAALPVTTAVLFEKGDFPVQQQALELLGAGGMCADMGQAWLCRRNGNTSMEKTQ
jgi:hypothetical protein